MTDRELLEAAAKAAGHKVNKEQQAERDSVVDPETAGLWLLDGKTWWNPLTDDGDALRLAVKLGIVWRYFKTDWRCRNGLIEVCVSLDDGQRPIHDEPVKDWSDIGATTRRAIVRAAAAIGGAQ